VPKPFTIDQYTITPVETEMEVNFIVSDSTGYICRLVPGQAGFEISKTDEALGVEIPLKLIAEISDHIVRKDA
jgi:hypothetical protein